MAKVNRFEMPGIAQQRNNYVSQYVPLPLEEIAGAVRGKQKEQDDNKAQQAKLLEDITKIKARKEDMGRLGEYNTMLDRELGALSDKVYGDTTDTSWKPQFLKLKNKVASDMSGGKLHAIQNNYDVYQKYQEARSKEKDYQEYRDRGYWDITEGNYKGAYDEKGGLNISSLDGFNERIDREKIADDIVKGINAVDINGVRAEVTFDEQGGVWKDKLTGQVISADKIAKTFDGAFQQSKAMDDIINEANFMEKQAEKMGKSFDRKGFVEQAYGQLRNSMIAKYTMSKTDPSRDFDYAPEHIHKIKNAPPAFEINGDVGASPIAALNNGNEYVKVDGTRVKGSEEFEKQLENRSVAGLFSSLNKNVKLDDASTWVNGIEQGIKDWWSTGKKGIDMDKLTGEDKRLVEIVEKKYGKIADKADLEDKLKKYGKEARETKQAYKVNILDDIAVANDKRFDQSNEEFNAKLFNPDKDGIVTDTGAVRGMKLYDETGKEIPGSELIGKKANVTGAMTNNNPYAPAAREIKSEDGKTYYAPGSSQEQLKNYQEWSFHQANYNVLGQAVVPIGDKSIQVQKDAEYNKDGSIKSAKYVFVDPNTNEKKTITASDSETAYKIFRGYFKKEYNIE